MGSDFPSERLQGIKRMKMGGGMDMLQLGSQKASTRGQRPGLVFRLRTLALESYPQIFRYAGVFVDQNNNSKKIRNVC